MPDEKVIQVQGHGEVAVAPDMAVLDLGVLSRERDARSAIQAASDQMRAIIDAVQGLGVPEHDIQTTQLNLFLDQQANLYTASHQIRIRAEDVGKAGAILDAAVGAGANVSAGIHFALTDQSEWEDQALTLAVADARRKADIVAAAAGVAVDVVQHVVVTGRGMVPDAPAFRRFALASAAAPTPIERGQLSVTADVQVSYSFR